MREGAWVPVSAPEQNRFPLGTLGLNRVKLLPQKIDPASHAARINKKRQAKAEKQPEGTMTVPTCFSEADFALKP